MFFVEGSSYQDSTVYLIKRGVELISWQLRTNDPIKSHCRNAITADLLKLCHSSCTSLISFNTSKDFNPEKNKDILVMVQIYSSKTCHLN